MMLYACRTCGYWRDMGLAESMSRALEVVAQLQGKEPPVHPGYPCPIDKEHGLMFQVQPDQRIYVRTGEVERMVQSVFDRKKKR